MPLTVLLAYALPPVAALAFAWGASRSIKKSAAEIDAMRAEQTSERRLRG